jgi:hypothetical protein
VGLHLDRHRYANLIVSRRDEDDDDDDDIRIIMI